MMEPKFQVGDVVEFNGVRGVVLSMEARRYPVHVSFEDSITCYFTLDGKFFDWHVTPSLKLIERPRRIVKKKVWITVYYSTHSDTKCSIGGTYSSKASADLGSGPGAIVQEVELEVYADAAEGGAHG